MAKKLEIDLKLFIGVIALVIIATVGSAYTTFVLFQNGSADTDSNSQEHALGSQKRDIGPTFDVGEFTVNLLVSGSQPRFIRTGIVVEALDKDVVTELQRREPQIRDRIIEILRLRTVEQLRSENGLKSLRTDITTAINDLLLQGKVVDLFFIDLVIQ